VKDQVTLRVYPPNCRPFARDRIRPEMSNLPKVYLLAHGINKFEWVDKPEKPLRMLRSHGS